MRALVLVGICLISTGCALPQWRIFQQKVPVDEGKAPVQVEAERRAASYLAQRSATPDLDPLKEIAEIHEVAVPLSASLGEPKKEVRLEDGRDQLIAELRAGLQAQQARAEAWKKFGEKYAHTKLEGTGINLAGPSLILVVVGVIALFVLVPGALTFALILIQRLKGTVRSMAQAVEEVEAKDPAKGKALKARVQAIGDKTHSRIIEQEKRKIDWKAVKEVAVRPA